MAEAHGARRGRASESGNAIQKALRVLEAAAAPDGPHRLAELAAASGVPKPTAHRVLGILVAEGFASTEEGGWYGPGPRLYALAAQVWASRPADISAVLTELVQAVGQTVHLAIRSGDHATYVAKIDPDQPYQMASRIGAQIPLHCSAIGKVLLAHLPAEEVEGILARTGLPGRTPQTITTATALRADLATTRARGYAIDDEENEATIRCIAAPATALDGTIVGAVSISTLTFLVDRGELESFVPHLRRTAGAAARLLTRPNGRE